LAAGNTFAVKQTGGEEKHTLTVDEMPSHSHGGKTSAPGNNKTGKPSKTTTGNNS
jgi:microcystin-dependent protein